MRHFFFHQTRDTTPFRGFLIASAVLFVICFMGAQGIYFESDDSGDRSTAYVSDERKKHARETGRYVIQYPLYVAVSYAGLVAKMKQGRMLP